MLRKATKDDKKVLEGLGEFVESLELDILNEVSKEIFYDILTYIFESEEDRFSHKYCTVYEKNGKILGFSFSYHYDNLDEMKDFWFNNVRSKFGLSDNSIIFDYDEMLEGEYYLDTIFVFEHARSLGVGTELLADFCYKDYPVKSLNVAKSNDSALRLYQRFGFYKTCEIFIGHEMYDHMILKNR